MRLPGPHSLGRLAIRRSTPQYGVAYPDSIGVENRVQVENRRVTTDDGTSLGVLEYGPPHGPPVLLLAGFRAPATSWRYQIRPLVRDGYRVLAADLRGHGTADPIGRRAGHATNMERPGPFNRALLEWLGAHP